MVKKFQSVQLDVGALEIILLLRYRTLNFNFQSSTFLSYLRISQITKIPIYFIRKILTLSTIEKVKRGEKFDLDIFVQDFHNQIHGEKRRSKLFQQHITYITNQNTLIQQSGKTLQERCTLFHRKFPECKISPSFLSCIYKKNGIKKKRITFKKKIKNQKNDEKTLEKILLIKKQIIDLQEKGCRIIYLDEIMFTYQTLYNSEYSNKNQHIEITEKLLQNKTKAVIACVSENLGLEYFEIYERSIDIEKFTLFIINLKRKINNENIALFLDNMRVHHSKKIKQLCKEYHIELVFNIPYSPEFNPIENVFSLVKNQYKRLKLSKIAQGEKFNVDKLIIKSFNSVDKKNIALICKSGYRRLME